MSKSAKKALIKVVKIIFIVGIPVVVQLLPTDMLNVTLGAVVLGLLNWAKYNTKFKFI